MDFSKRLRTASASGSTSASFDRENQSTGTTSVGGSAMYPPDDLFGGVLHASGSRKGKERVYSDRFIPSRDSSMDLSTSYQLMEAPAASTSNRGAKRKIERGPENDSQRDASRTFNALLKSELFGNESSNNAADVDFLTGSPTSSRYQPAPHSTVAPGSLQQSPSRQGLFTYSSPSRSRANSGGPQNLDSPTHERYATSPVRYESQKLLLSPRKQPRNLSKVPYKVLDAPELADDFYLNLVDWSATNILGVGLGACVYLWSAATAKVTKLCDLADQDDSVTSLAWVNRGSQIAIGTNKGLVKIWDAERIQQIRQMTGHTARIGALAWNEHILSSGSRDRFIYHRDVRIPAHHIKRLAHHKQEVCGLKWNVQENMLASGGNDNKLLVFHGIDGEQPLFRFSDHVAAVKAIAWNPHQHGILASGGGTADKKIRFWNTLTGNQISEVNTGSQVCNLLWSKNSNELVSTHGFSAEHVQNQVCIWRYPSLSQVATLTGHTFRVLYLASSPDGQTIVTGAGDETLRFWHAFPKTKQEKRADSSTLNLTRHVR